MKPGIINLLFFSFLLNDNKIKLIEIIINMDNKKNCSFKYGNTTLINIVMPIRKIYNPTSFFLVIISFIFQPNKIWNENMIKIKLSKI